MADCTLACLNNGLCMFGAADFSVFPTYDNGRPFDFHETNNINGMFCECESGYTGLDCGIAYTPCDDEGTIGCFNGGKCVARGNDQPFCDCSEPVDPSTPAAGKFCEFEPTSICDLEGPFCYNGGLCSETGSGCVCPADLFGPGCEFLVGESIDTACELICENGGTCTLDGNTQSCDCLPGYTGMQCELVAGCTMECLNGGVCAVNTNDESMSCVCIDGFSGTLCEVQGEIIPVCSMDCKNGGQCFLDGDTESMTCICPEAFVGMQCELEGAACTMECLNGGVCEINANDGSMSCICIGGFSGTQCDIQLSPVATPATSMVPTGSFLPSYVPSALPSGSFQPSLAGSTVLPVSPPSAAAGIPATMTIASALVAVAFLFK